MQQPYAVGYDINMTMELGPVLHLGDSEVRVGTCSSTDKTLVKDAASYPKRSMSAAERLAFYAARFPVVEADSAYYRPPTGSSPGVGGAEAGRVPLRREGVLASDRPPTRPDALWPTSGRARSGRGRTSGTSSPTHLPDDTVDQVWGRFIDALRPLGDAGRRGAVLLQYPPWFTPEKADRASWPGRDRLGDVPTVELRSPLWFGADDVDRTVGRLADHDFTLVGVDAPSRAKLSPASSPGPPSWPWSASTVAPTTRGRNAPGGRGAVPVPLLERQLRHWVDRIAEVNVAAREVRLLMNNCYQDYGVDNAEDMTERC